MDFEDGVNDEGQASQEGCNTNHYSAMLYDYQPSTYEDESLQQLFGQERNQHHHHHREYHYDASQMDSSSSTATTSWPTGLDPTPIAQNASIQIVDQISPVEFLSRHSGDNELVKNLLATMIRPLSSTHSPQADHPQSATTKGDRIHNEFMLQDGENIKDTLSLEDTKPRAVNPAASASNVTAVSVSSGSDVSLQPSSSLSASSSSNNCCAVAGGGDISSAVGVGPLNQHDQWARRFDELCQFKMDHGHCNVPYNYEDNPSLAQWIKRQRHQRKRRREGKHSTLPRDREDLLTQLGFVWDAHQASWDVFYEELCEYRERKGHCNVPVRYATNPQLGVWVKLQRRQYRLYKKRQGMFGMTHERVRKLESLGFVWDPRNVDH